MTVKLNLKNIKDKLKDNSLDLSLCELKEVPVREIASVRKATDVNLSTNLLVSLPTTFVTLRQIVKLDLSRNMLTELPENFGEMTQLKYLDLYANQISRLPLSLSELKNLRWLDLKENPLTEAVASVAGPCSNLSECQACARNVVNYLSTVKLLIEEEKLRRLNNTTGETEKEVTAAKKENKKKKKRDSEKEHKTSSGKIGASTQNKDLQDNNDNIRLTELSDNNSRRELHKFTADGNSSTRLYRSLKWMTVWLFIISSLLTITLIVFSWRYEQQTDTFLQNAQMLSGLPLRRYHKHTIDLLQRIIDITALHVKSVTDVINDFYETHFKSNTNNARNDL
ncbi:PREDICTED: leucine-rich repeat-containing protein 59 [Dinoponera quadriceps]|uniref:Leucine-rich repeat-containing protein 59 n=1 Tax=Dinoponera quadriceps TaxID=609295 RepID=A0A6P3X7B2_DINQU|nr:PREDICTED: leucine-rich repeat-containing protein 59 [Dinoponera quadriceps]